MKYVTSPKKYAHRFDFEIGYLVQSPCKECEIIHQFPKCMDTCELIDAIHLALAEAVSCSRN